jgi:hypothetical protein
MVPVRRPLARHRRPPHTDRRSQDGMLDLIQELARLPTDPTAASASRPRTPTTRSGPVHRARALMNAADLYVTTTGGEGFGLNLAESLACEVPVVSPTGRPRRRSSAPAGSPSRRSATPTASPSATTPVRDGLGGPRSRGFVEPVLSLLAKPSRRRALGAEGRRHVVRSFSWDTGRRRVPGPVRGTPMPSLPSVTDIKTYLGLTGDGRRRPHRRAARGGHRHGRARHRADVRLGLQHEHDLLDQQRDAHRRSTTARSPTPAGS